ncbi:MAG: sn-glycerol-3-phosphate ABC transporter ATP-binding protein UgpC [Acidimicrobiales bacterium]|nr:sn-glycerol-3-phosphate ABC transporter ATP-binding protein UgpC [Acidimicrobiales bacterium]MDP6894809.1 sn-glycerol-3-phosphate ABC transporter ATP-binding protein UgpC [Acidimicrobiales bacterium]HJM37723.1 sn-glycerol-3-phosphate ABC transporter ATP-binding protein UgpC [Acidimicrobiales bacterium]
MAELSLEGLTKIYPNGFKAVDELNIDIADGEFLVLVGPSGCGKSTALRMVAGLEEITSGNLSINGDLMNDVEPKDRNIAMVFQNYALYPHLDVEKNIGFALKLSGLSKQEIDSKVSEAAKILELEPLMKNKPAQLSGGQRQRVAMGRAIVRDPSVFLMDEPLSNLDAKLRVQMRAEITRLQHRLEATTLYVTHDQVEAMTMGDRVAVMKDGVLQQIDNPSSLYEKPENLFVAGFIGAPAMNLREAKLTNDNGEWALQIGSTTMPLARGIVENRRSLAQYDGRTVVIGIRPEAMDDANISSNKNLPVLSAVTELTEALGSDLLVHFPLDAKAVDAGDPDALKDLDENPLMVARVDPRSQTKPGEKIEISVDTERIHFFDPETRLAIRS